MPSAGVQYPCPHCHGKKPVANVSVFDLIRQTETDGEIRSHALVDVGLASWTATAIPSAPTRPAWTGFSSRIGHRTTVWSSTASARRCGARPARRGETFSRIPTWCRGGTGEWLARNYSYELYLLPRRPALEGDSEPPGALLDPHPLWTAGIKVTPLSVSHSVPTSTPEFQGDPVTTAPVWWSRPKEDKVFLEVDNRMSWVLDLPGVAVDHGDCCRGRPASSSNYTSSWTVEEVVRVRARERFPSQPPENHRVLHNRRHRFLSTWAGARKARATPAGAPAARRWEGGR